jgi:hypothetical protein
MHEILYINFHQSTDFLNYTSKLMHSKNQQIF